MHKLCKPLIIKTRIMYSPLDQKPVLISKESPHIFSERERERERAVPYFRSVPMRREFYSVANCHDFPVLLIQEQALHTHSHKLYSGHKGYSLATKDMLPWILVHRRKEQMRRGNFRHITMKGFVHACNSNNGSHPAYCMWRYVMLCD